MIRAVVIAAALGAGAKSGFTLPLYVQASEDVWPSWVRLVARFPLPPDVQVVRVQPSDAPPSGDLAVLGLGSEGKVIDFMPLVPVTTLGNERLCATTQEVESKAVRLTPLGDVALPDIALPLDGFLPDQRGYPLFQKVAVRLSTSNSELASWYDSLTEPSRPASGQEAGIVWIEAVGDLMPARGVDNALLSDQGLERVFGNTLALLRGSDFLLGNLESSTARDGTPQNKSYTFRFRAEAVDKLKEAGFSYLSLANNHTFDFGQAGFLETLDSLSRWGILTSGAGGNLREAESPTVVKKGDLEIRILSFGDFPVDRTGFDGKVSERARESRPGILWLDDQGLSEAGAAFAGGPPGTFSFNIAFVHGGEEWRTTPTPDQMRLYRELIRRGANLVLGAHPHVLEGMEAVGGNLIAYSLGNFLFPGMEGTSGGEDSVILRLGIFEGKIRYVQVIPVRLRGGTVRRADDHTALKEILSRTRALSSVGPAR